MAAQDKNIFVGRKESVEQLEHLLSDHLNDQSKHVRIISIFGKSGVGKSYLVNHVCQPPIFHTNDK